MSRGVKSRWRFRLLQVGVLLVGTALAARVVFIQVLRHDQWLNKANGQWTRTVEVEAERGNLYDRNGRPLALSVSSWRLGIAGSRVDDAPELARRLGEILDRDPAPLLQSIRKAGQDHVVLDRNIVLTRDQKRQLMIEPAVTLEDLRARVYPHDGVGASLIGFYRHDKDEAVATGLELGLADVLAGRSGTAQEIESAVKGRQMGRIVLEEARHGRNVKLTLDIDLQAICERELAASVTECGADGGCVLVLDPDNGDVLASASWPLLSSRDRPQRDERVWINGNFTQQFEPGSVFKIFSTASLLRNGAVDTATVYDCSNGDFGRFSIRNSEGHAYGNLPLMQAFSRSSNIYFARAVGNLSSHELYRDLVDFGFGQPTASQYPGQAAGLLAAPATWSGRSKPTIAIGQEVAVTPLQLGLAVCAVANDGVLYAPRLYDEIRDERGRVMQEVPPAPLRRVMARPLATLLREAMRRVVVEGTGQGAKLDWISAAGKTGTAQKCRDGRGYAPGAYMACFAGMVPAEQPELVILTVLDEPDARRHYASQSAVPMFAAIVREIRRSTDWLTRSPGSQTHVLNRSDGETCVVPDVLHLNADGARRRIVAAGLQVAGAEKDGIVVQQIPAAGTICAAGQNVTLTVAGSRDPVAETAPICPDFVGLSNRQVHSLAARLGLPVELAGVGYVVAQQPAPGTQLAVGPVHLELEGPWH